jgi:hypothetical protein
MTTIEVCGIEELKRDLAKLSAAVAPLGAHLSGEALRHQRSPARSTFVDFASNDCLVKRPGSGRDLVWLVKPDPRRFNLYSSWRRFINGLVEAQGWLGWWGCTQPLARKCQGLPISVEVLDGSPPSPPSRDHFPPGNPAVRAVCAPQCHRADAHVAMRSEPIAESPGVELAAAKRRQLDCLP